MRSTAKKPRSSWAWSDADRPGVEWLADVEGESLPARIRISSRNSDGSYSYFCYRDAQAIAVVHDLEAAKRACERGEDPRLSRSVMDYVEQHPNELPPFLALTQGERRAVRGQYPYALPPQRVLGRALDRERGLRDAGDDSDPGTAKVRAALAAGRAEAAGGRVAKGAPPAREARAALPAGTLVRVKDTNPKKAGTGAHKRWEAMFEHCARGSTVAAYEAAKLNMDTLANAVRSGHVSIKGGK